MRTLKAVTVLYLAVAGGVGYAQVNILSDVVNFRTTADRDHETIHYGNLEVRGDASATGNAVLYSVNESGSSSTRYAVYGFSNPAPGYGIGGYFVGGERGVMGYCGPGGDAGSRTGGFFQAAGTGNATKYAIYAYVTGSGTKWSGYFTGASIYVNGTTYPSDKKLKTGNQAIEGALEKVAQLRPQTYYYDTTSYKQMGFSPRRQYGLVAQDVEAAIPEIVTTVPMPDASGNPGTASTFKGIDYVSLIPILVAAIQEQQKEIEELRAAVGR